MGIIYYAKIFIMVVGKISPEKNLGTRKISPVTLYRGYTNYK